MIFEYQDIQNKLVFLFEARWYGSLTSAYIEWGITEPVDEDVSPVVSPTDALDIITIDIDNQPEGDWDQYSGELDLTNLGLIDGQIYDIDYKVYVAGTYGGVNCRYEMLRIEDDGNLYVDYYGSNYSKYVYFSDGTDSKAAYLRYQAGASNQFVLSRGIYIVNDTLVERSLIMNASNSGLSDYGKIIFYDDNMGVYNGVFAYDPSSHYFYMDHYLDMGSNNITSLATPTADTDAATKAYVDGQTDSTSTGLTSSTNITSTNASYGNGTQLLSLASLDAGVWQITYNVNCTTTSSAGGATGAKLWLEDGSQVVPYSADLGAMAGASGASETYFLNSRKTVVVTLATTTTITLEGSKLNSSTLTCGGTTNATDIDFRTDMCAIKISD